MATKTSKAPFISLVSVFFFWGFVAASNDILIPVFKDALNLSQAQSNWVAIAFYIAYTVGSLIYLGISFAMGKDILLRIGYKTGISLGLVISALGTLLFIPAASMESFGLMLSGLFVIGLGFSLQQTAANPLVINMGDSKKGSQRLSLAGGINNVGTTIGPVLISLAIFGMPSDEKPVIGIESIKIPYLILGAAFLLVAALIYFSKLPNRLPEQGETAEKDHGNTNDDVIDQPLPEEKKASAGAVLKKSILQYPQLIFGMIAIFVYVGVEVATAANLGEYLKQEHGMTNESITPYVSLFWASLMIGRWTSASSVFTKNKSLNNLLSVLLPYAAFGVFLLVNTINGQDLGPLYYYAAMLVLIIGANYISKDNPSRQLLLFSLLGIVALIVGILTTGLTSIYSIISVGLFCSTLWPCIFTLSIAGLGSQTSRGSGLLVMMIMGGGIISWLQGIISDSGVGIKGSFIVGIFCFAYLAFYAILAARTLKKQGIDFAE